MLREYIVLNEKKYTEHKVNLIVASVQNDAVINMSVKRDAQSLIKNGKVNDTLLNMESKWLSGHMTLVLPVQATHSLGKCPWK